MKNRLFGFLASAALAATALSAATAPAASADEPVRLPATDFKPCGGIIVTTCIESMTFEIDGAGKFTGIWVPTGQPAPTDDTSIAPVLNPTSDKSFNTYPGRWSFSGLSTAGFGYDGVYAQVGPASTASDVLWIRMQPASARADGTVGKAVAAEGSTTTRDLDPSVKMTLVLRIGDLAPSANVVVGDATLTASTAGAPTPTVTFSGYPAQVAQSASSASCEGEAGISSALVNQMYGFVAFSNTRQAYGYDGMSGRLSVSTNGTCYITTPTYDPATSSFSFVAGAPHFAPDGTTVNRGFYIASIPLADAAMLFGITDPKQVKTALVVTIQNDQGEDIPVTYTVSVTKGVISVAATNFQFSKPTFTLKIKPALWKKKYKKAAEAARAKAKG